MTCTLCWQGDLQPGRANDTLSCEGTTLVVLEIPALICGCCGAACFDADVTQRLLDLARGAAAAGVLVGVRRYVAA